MGVAPSDTIVWTCPDCGHGSPEPRDRQAHLDAHQQLRRFFEQWESAAVADAAAERRARRRPYLVLTAFLAAVALVAGVGLWGHRTVAPPIAPSPAGRVPGMNLPGSATAPPAAPPDAVAAPPTAPPVAPAPAARPAPVALPAPAVAAEPHGAAATVPSSDGAPAPAPAVRAPEPTAPLPPAPLLTIRACLGVVCVGVG